MIERVKHIFEFIGLILRLLMNFNPNHAALFKETKSATMNIFDFFIFFLNHL